MISFLSVLLCITLLEWGNTEEGSDCQYIDNYNGRLYERDTYLLKKKSNVVICPLLSSTNRIWSIDTNLPNGLVFVNGKIYGSPFVNSDNTTYTIQVQESFPEVRTLKQSISLSVYTSYCSKTEDCPETADKNTCTVNCAFNLGRRSWTCDDGEWSSVEEDCASVYVFVFVSIGCVAILILFYICYCICLCKKKKKKVEGTNEGTEIEMTSVPSNEPVEHANPVESVESVESVEPIEPIEPVEPDSNNDEENGNSDYSDQSQSVPINEELSSVPPPTPAKPMGLGMMVSLPEVHYDLPPPPPSQSSAVDNNTSSLPPPLPRNPKPPLQSSSSEFSPIEDSSQLPSRSYHGAPPPLPSKPSKEEGKEVLPPSRLPPVLPPKRSFVRENRYPPVVDSSEQDIPLPSRSPPRINPQPPSRPAPPLLNSSEHENDLPPPSRPLPMNPSNQNDLPPPSRPPPLLNPTNQNDLPPPSRPPPLLNPTNQNQPPSRQPPKPVLFNSKQSNQNDSPSPSYSSRSSYSSYSSRSSYSSYSSRSSYSSDSSDNELLPPARQAPSMPEPPRPSRQDSTPPPPPFIPSRQEDTPSPSRPPPFIPSRQEDIPPSPPRRLAPSLSTPTLISQPSRKAPTLDRTVSETTHWNSTQSRRPLPTPPLTQSTKSSAPVLPPRRSSLSSKTSKPSLPPKPQVINDSFFIPITKLTIINTHYTLRDTNQQGELHYVDSSFTQEDLQEEKNAFLAIHHPNVVPFVGFSKRQNRIAYLADEPSKLLLTAIQEKNDNIFIIEAVTSILYAIRYVVSLRVMAMGNISSQDIYYDERKDTVKIGLPLCKKMIQKNGISLQKDFEDLAIVLREIAENVKSEPIQMSLLSASEYCKTKSQITDFDAILEYIMSEN